MISISFISKVFMITIIFMIILTSVSTAPRLYQMVQKNEDYIQYKNRPMNEWEVKMDIGEFYNTIHNMDTKNIPDPVKKYDHDEYLRVTNTYCISKYVTKDIFKQVYQTEEFIIAVMNLRTCFDKHYTQKDDDGNRSDRVSYVKNKFIKQIERQPDSRNSVYSDDLLLTMAKMKRCFNAAFESVDSTSFDGCFEYRYREDEFTKKFAKDILEIIKKEVEFEYLENFKSCTKTFKSHVESIFSFNQNSYAVKKTETQPEKPKSQLLSFLPNFTKGFFTGRKKQFNSDKTQFGLQTLVENIDYDFTVKELFLVRSLLSHNELKAERIDFQSLFFAYTQTKELIITDFDKENCKAKYKALDMVRYTATKMFYMMFPPYPKYNTNDYIKEFKDKRKAMLNHLKAIDYQNNTVYDRFFTFNDKIIDEDIKKMLKRRAMLNEPNYNIYAMRIIYMSDYLPLPKYLWMKELEQVDKKKLKPFMDREYSNDLFENRNKIARSKN